MAACHGSTHVDIGKRWSRICLLRIDPQTRRPHCTASLCERLPLANRRFPREGDHPADDATPVEGPLSGAKPTSKCPPWRPIERLMAGPGPMAYCAASSAFLRRHCYDARRREYIRASLVSQRTGSILIASTTTPRSTPSPLPVNAIDVVPSVNTWGSTAPPRADRSTGLRITAVHIPDAVGMGDIAVAVTAAFCPLSQVVHRRPAGRLL